MSEQDDLARRVLRMFVEFEKETLDLHELFEAGDSNDPDARRAVFYQVERLVEDGLLEERGNDFYALTAAGRDAAQHAAPADETE
ncbi:MAG TPA: hypothetical protein VNA19_17715 [Pyrinomonadaceae bacterium]|nr:hypothetical protein [Pyrinomonadaceae bacterium]